MTAPQVPGDTAAPWPLVGECYTGAPSFGSGHACPQCDGSHDHAWTAWHQRPTIHDGGTSVVAQQSGPGVPVRCRVCGARKCDTPVCRLRRHHGGPHDEF